MGGKIDDKDRAAKSSDTAGDNSHRRSAMPKRMSASFLTSTAIAVAMASICSFAALSQDVLPRPEPAFKGVIGRKARESKPNFPQGVSAPKNAPNVLLILTDDTGFGASSTFGGPIPTPNLERIHQNGLC